MTPTPATPAAAAADMAAGRIPPARVLIALAWIIGRKSDPGYTLEAARGLGLGDLDGVTDALDLDGLTLGDVADLEDASGMELAELLDSLGARDEDVTPDPA